MGTDWNSGGALSSKSKERVRKSPPSKRLRNALRLQRFLEKKVAQEPQDSNKAGGFDGSGTPGPQP